MEQDVENGNKTTVAVSLEKAIAETKDSKNLEIIRSAVERAHQATRLASRLLTFHLLKCLERSLPLPSFGHTNWAYKAWNCVTQASRRAATRQDDPELLRTLEEFMPDAAPVDSTKMGAIMQFEANRWATGFTNNVYVHFAARVKSYVNRAYWLDKDALKAMPKADKLRRRKELAQVARDLCSDPNGEQAAPESYRSFIEETRSRWKLEEFPWNGVPLTYHLKANDAKDPNKCHAHLLLRAMWHMRIQRQVDGRKGFALAPLRTTLVPRHTQFGADTLRSLLGLGLSEHSKERNREYNKRRKLSVAGSSAQHATLDEEDEDGAEEPPAAGKRRRRLKAEVKEEKRRDLARVFDLKRAGVHAVSGKEFDGTFTTDGVAAHLQFSKPPKAKEAKKPKGVPRRGLFDVDALRERLGLDAFDPCEGNAVDAAHAPCDKLAELLNEHKHLTDRFVCVGCDPGRNELVNMAVLDYESYAKLRMTACDRRFHYTPAKPHSNLKYNAAAAEYRRLYVEKPEDIHAMECKLGQQGCATAPCLLHFGTYVDALEAHEAALVPHYAQLHHRNLRRKAFIERQRYDAKFANNIKKAFDPDLTGKTIVLAWGAWGKLAGRAGTPGNRGRPPAIGVGLAKRLAKERGIVVMWTPEHHTTKTHFKSGGECVRMEAAERRRAADHGFHEPKEIRGLKICHNPECPSAPVNRDHNAALNIYTNGLLLLHGYEPIRKHVGDEVEILRLENEMTGA
jgi:hypothetical protein